jgi:assimilatory nitrate reductase catalytic subunit
VLRVRLTADLRPDLLFVPFHWGGIASVNRLTDPALDPRSRMPAFKACAARIDPLPTDARPGRPTERT